MAIILPNYYYYTPEQKQDQKYDPWCHKGNRKSWWHDTLSPKKQKLQTKPILENEQSFNYINTEILDRKPKGLIFLSHKLLYGFHILFYDKLLYRFSLHTPSGTLDSQGSVQNSERKVNTILYLVKISTKNLLK